MIKIANIYDDLLNLYGDTGNAKALAYHDTVLPLMSEIRTHADALELIVDDEMWTLPKYRELLFIR